jgi:hypothetical protein
LISLLSKSQRTINRTRPSNIARALPNPPQDNIPHIINTLPKKASDAHARNPVKICQERQKNVAEWSWPKAHVFPSEPGRFDHANSCYLFVLGLLKMSNFLMTLLQPIIRAEGLSFEQRQSPFLLALGSSLPAHRFVLPALLAGRRGVRDMNPA